MSLLPVFKSFLQAGFECSTHKLASGKRLDLVASTRHDEFVAQDYARLREFGITTVREGLRWPLIEQTPGNPDFRTVSPILAAAESAKIQIIWDLLHFGWPDHLDIFDKGWPEAFGHFACAFAHVLRSEARPPYFIAAVNEISFVSWAGGDAGFLNPFAVNRGGELKRQLVRGFLAATDAVRAVLPDVKIVSPEPVIHIIGRPDVPGDAENAERYRMSMFEAWDMLLGRAQPELGGSEDRIDVIGVNYYDRNQWWNHGNTIRRNEPEYRPFRQILAEVHEHYRLPIFVSETGTESAARPGWFAYISEEVRAAEARGVPMQGICLYPILNHPGWEDDRHCHNGLWDYATDTGFRPVYQPLADEIDRQNLIRETFAKGIAT